MPSGKRRAEEKRGSPSTSHCERSHLGCPLEATLSPFSLSFPKGAREQSKIREENNPSVLHGTSRLSLSSTRKHDEVNQRKRWPHDAVPT